MAERLTRNNKVNFYFHDEASNMVYYKLQGLEDILEKYGIESVEELDETLDDNQYSKEAFSKLQASYQQLETDRDTWKRACELALKEDYPNRNIPKEDWNEHLEIELNYFYQQAKKE